VKLKQMAQGTFLPERNGAERSGYYCGHWVGV